MKLIDAHTHNAVLMYGIHMCLSNFADLVPAVNYVPLEAVRRDGRMVMR